MIKLAFKNKKFLKFISKIPGIQHFFILKISESFTNIEDDALLNKFYSDIYVASKTSKQTASKRFEDLDIVALKYMQKQQNVIHDIAVSNGITSNDWFDILVMQNVQFCMYISDKYARIFVKKGFAERAYDIDKNFIFGYFGSVLAVDKNIFFPVSKIAYEFLKRMKNDCVYDYSLLLFHPQVIKKITDKLITNIDYDIFHTKIATKFTFVRCMNILNKNYFTENQIINAIINIYESLQVEGTLLVGRTISNKYNTATFFRKLNNRFIILEDINNGSEVKDLILNLKF